MVTAALTLLAALIGGFAGSLLCYLLTRETPHESERGGGTKPSPTGLRKPVYNSPEKAALAEESRKLNLPPQWTRIVGRRE